MCIRKLALVIQMLFDSLDGGWNVDIFILIFIWSVGIIYHFILRIWTLFLNCSPGLVSSGDFCAALMISWDILKSFYEFFFWIQLAVDTYSFIVRDWLRPFGTRCNIFHYLNSFHRATLWAPAAVRRKLFRIRCLKMALVVGDCLRQLFTTFFL